MSMFENLIRDENLPGIEIVEFRGGPGYDDERLVLENGLSNGLRFLTLDDGDAASWTHFHIKSPETARLIAQRLLEFAERIADPPGS